MKKIIRLILFILYLSVPAMGQISYDITHSNTLISYSNQAGGQFSTNTSFSNITVHETELARFLVTTNGGDLYTGSNFMINIRAVDRRGYHITLTNATNLQLLALDSNTNLTGTNFSLTNLIFVSPSAVVPDFNGISANISYPVADMVYLEIAGNTNTNTPGLLHIKSIIQQIFALNPVFVPQQQFTNIQIYGIDINGQTNEISDMYDFSTLDSDYLTVAASNRIYTVTVGPGVLNASNKYDPSLSTNITVLVTVLPGDTAGVTNSNATVTVAADSFNGETYVDLRTTQDPALLIYPLNNYLSDRTADVNEANSAVDLTGAGEYVYTNKNIQLTALETNGSETTSPYSGGLTVTFSYTESDLLTGAGDKISEERLGIVKLTNDNGNYRWITLSNCVLNAESNTISIIVSNNGVYALASMLNKIPSDLKHAEVFPNPADLSAGHQITIFNLPDDTERVEIYRVDGKRIRTLTGVTEQSLNGAVVNGLRWNGTLENGEKAPAGLYFINIITPDNSRIVKMVINNTY